MFGYDTMKKFFKWILFEFFTDLPFIQKKIHAEMQLEEDLYQAEQIIRQYDYEQELRLYKDAQVEHSSTKAITNMFSNCYSLQNLTINKKGG
jgi:hypothetical protein